MSNFPNTFAETIEPMQPGIGQLGDQALARLNERGLNVATGLTEYFAGAVGVMGYQSGIREYCSKDSTIARFATLTSTEAWLEKNGGRGMFLLLSGEGSAAQLEGYGWTGLEECAQLPNHPITSAYRIGERSAGSGYGKDFAQVIVSGTNALFAPGEGIGLETWESNKVARAIYQGIGFKLLAKAAKYELRPTLDSDFVNAKTRDRRLYMGYPQELLSV